MKQQKTKDMENKIIAIGTTANYVCYLNITKDEAIKRYKERVFANEDIINPVKEIKYSRIIEFEFDDEFWTYQVGMFDEDWWMNNEPQRIYQD